MATRVPGGYNPAAVAITGGTITGTNVPYVAKSGGLAFIHLSTGSISAAGALTGITALPLAYPAAYCYFPANAVATVAAAGWYYTEFSSTTAGTVYLDTYTSGTPAIPAKTPVTDGKGAYTGDIAERIGPTYTLAANSMGIYGTMTRTYNAQFNNTVGNKSIKTKLGGTDLLALARTTTLMSDVIVQVQNQGQTGKQLITAREMYATSGNDIASTLGTLDTTGTLAVAYSLTKAVATDNCILEAYRDEIRYVPT